jgi:hypothetical protein
MQVHEQRGGYKPVFPQAIDFSRHARQSETTLIRTDVRRREIWEWSDHTLHASLRRRCAAYRRHTNMYAKNTGRLQERLDVYWVVHNFVRVHFTTRQVPAVALGILDHGFALHEIFLIQKVA